MCTGQKRFLVEGVSPFDRTNRDTDYLVGTICRNLHFKLYITCFRIKVPRLSRSGP